MIVEIILASIGLILSAYFSGSEIASYRQIPSNYRYGNLKVCTVLH